MRAESTTPPASTKDLCIRFVHQVLGESLLKTEIELAPHHSHSRIRTEDDSEENESSNAITANGIQ